jgi:hypothetical protein
VPVSGRRAAQDGWNSHQELFQTEKDAKHGNMTKHGRFAEIASRQCFCKGVFTQPRSSLCENVVKKQTSCIEGSMSASPSASDIG